MEVLEIVNGDFCKEALEEMKKEKLQEIEDIKKEVIIDRKKIDRIKSEQDLNYRYSIKCGKDPLILEEYIALKKSHDKLSSEFILNNDRSEKVKRLDNEIQIIDELLK